MHDESDRRWSAEANDLRRRSAELKTMIKDLVLRYRSHGVEWGLAAYDPEGYEAGIHRMLQEMIFEACCGTQMRSLDFDRVSASVEERTIGLRN